MAAGWPAADEDGGETDGGAEGERGPAASDSAPTTGEPIGVLPTRAIDHKAVTRPR